MHECQTWLQVSCIRPLYVVSILESNIMKMIRFKIYINFRNIFFVDNNVLSTNVPQQIHNSPQRLQRLVASTSFQTTREQVTNRQRNESRVHNSELQQNSLPRISIGPRNTQKLSQNIIPINENAIQVPQQQLTSHLRSSRPSQQNQALNGLDNYPLDMRRQKNLLQSSSNSSIQPRYIQNAEYFPFRANSLASAHCNRLPNTSRIVNSGQPSNRYPLSLNVEPLQPNYRLPSTSYGSQSYNVPNEEISEENQNQGGLSLPHNLRDQQHLITMNLTGMASQPILLQNAQQRQDQNPIQVNQQIVPVTSYQQQRISAQQIPVEEIVEEFQMETDPQNSEQFRATRFVEDTKKVKDIEQLVPQILFSVTDGTKVKPWIDGNFSIKEELHLSTQFALFKCMETTCTFSSHDPAKFRKHIDLHQKSSLQPQVSKFGECAYCTKSFIFGGVLTGHRQHFSMCKLFLSHH